LPHALRSRCYIRCIGTYEQLREAILTRQQVVAYYGGHERVFCPHILGWKDGAERCLVYQFAGSSRSGRIGPGSPDSWRCLRVEEVQIVRLQAGPWYTGPSHERTQRCLDTVDVDSEKPETLKRARMLVR
jgi:hypothetical protein